MKTENKQPEFMLLFRGNDWYKGLSPEEIQRVTSQWMDWFTRLTGQGKVTAGSPLEAEIRIVSSKSGQVVADGPFTESKEAVGGYFLLRVDTFDEAVAIARQCPGLPYGSKVEVRQVAEICPLSAEAKAEPELAHAQA